MYKIAFLVLLCIFGLIITPSSFAITYQDDSYEILGRTLTHNPTVCAFEPETDIKDAWKKLSKYTRGSVMDWENKLNEHVRSHDTWNVDLQLIQLEKQNGSIDCDITVKYLPKPENKKEEFEVAGVTHRNGLNNQDVVIYYLNIDLERLDYTIPGEDSSYYYSVVEFIPSYSDFLAPESQLRVVIKHEIGHALGLGHYITKDEERTQRWIDGAERPPSIMLQIRPTKVISTDITSLDIEKLVGIYGKDGFYLEEYDNSLNESLITDSQKVVLPDWIRNNAKWWSEGIITDKDFASGIEFMIKNEIIELGVTGTDKFTVEQEIPEWVKSNAKWWSDKLIADDEFVRGLQYLVKNGIIQV